MVSEQADLYDWFGRIASMLEWTVSYAGAPCGSASGSMCVERSALPINCSQKAISAVAPVLQLLQTLQRTRCY
jgi:hypothetical protein